MSNQITKQFLQAQVDRLNRTMKMPMEPYTKTGDKYAANIGNYHLDGAYGGWALHRMGNESGGISDVFRCGHVSKRELSGRISAMLDGIEAMTPTAQE